MVVGGEFGVMASVSRLFSPLPAAGFASPFILARLRVIAVTVAVAVDLCLQ